MSKCEICGKDVTPETECAYTGCPYNWDESKIDQIGQNGEQNE
jgi:hypothetical protein